MVTFNIPCVSGAGLIMKLAIRSRFSQCEHFSLRFGKGRETVPGVISRPA